MSTLNIERKVVVDSLIAFDFIRYTDTLIQAKMV